LKFREKMKKPNELFSVIDSEDLTALRNVLSVKSIDLWNWFELSNGLSVTPLGYAIYMNRYKVVEYLLENWVQFGGMSHCGNWGLNIYHNCYQSQEKKMEPLELARYKQFKSIKTLLLKHIKL